MLILLFIFAAVSVGADPILNAVHANTYYGYAKESPNVAVLIPSNIAADNKDVPINRDWQTIVLVHEYNGDLRSEFNQMVKREILNNRNANVIVVDWSASSKLDYNFAADAVLSVGRSLADFLIKLESQKENYDVDNALNDDDAGKIKSQGIGRIQFNNTHLVGFDLGAHVVGQAGREILLRTGKPVARITGLDADRIQWGRSSCLAKTDATYVEVIHTDGDGLLSNGIGVAFGDVDFFVNGGNKQPGCRFHDCSHKRAYELFAATFARTEKLYGNYCPTMMQLALNKCRSLQLHVGDDTLAKSRVDGIYRVDTGSTYPY